MNPTLQSIKERINAIQSGLLRFRERGEQVTIQVKAVLDEEDALKCVTVDVISQKLNGRQVTFIQKYKDDYIYVTGKVYAQVRNAQTVVAISIGRACWFTRQSRDTVTWLDEKCIYTSADRFAVAS